MMQADAGWQPVDGRPVQKLSAVVFKLVLTLADHDELILCELKKSRNSTMVYFDFFISNFLKGSKLMTRVWDELSAAVCASVVPFGEPSSRFISIFMGFTSTLLLLRFFFLTTGAPNSEVLRFGRSSIERIWSPDKSFFLAISGIY